MDRKIILWSIALFFGCSILFAAIDRAVGDSGTGVSLAVQAGAMLIIVAAVVFFMRRKS